jgi:hypothetical protein
MTVLQGRQGKNKFGRKIAGNKLLLLTFFSLSVFSLPLLAGQKEDSTQAIVKYKLYESRKTEVNAYPYIYYTPETELAFGAGGIMTFFTSGDLILRPSKFTLSGYYSTLKQYEISLATDVYMIKNRTFLHAALDFGDYIDKYWGIGNETPELDNPKFNSRVWNLELEFQFPPILDFLSQTKSGIYYDFDNYHIYSLDNPLLADSALTGLNGGICSGLGAVLVWDNRNSIFYPTSGGFHHLKMLFYRKELGSDFSYNYFEADLRQYTALNKNNVFAFQIYYSVTTGDPPFYKLPALGGSQIMRGYYQGRYRNKNYFAAQLEYRLHLYGRWGMTAFAGMGRVGEKIKDFNFRGMKVSTGAGLRFLFNKEKKINVRMDIGFGRNTSGVYFGIEEAF